MKIRIKFFAILRESVGAESIRMSVENGSTLKDLKDMLIKKYGMALNLNRSVVFAVNGALVKEDVMLRDNDEVALLPPVSGER